MENVTLERMMEQDDVYQGIMWAKEQIPTYISKPKRPGFIHNMNSEQVKQYAIELAQWESDIEKYNTEVQLHDVVRNQIDGVIIEYIKEMSGLYTIPEQYRSKVYSYAWECGHSSGYYEVFICLTGLVEIFK